MLFPFRRDPLRGIIAHLTARSGGNVHERGVVKITVSSGFVNPVLGTRENVPEHAANLSDFSYFGSQRAPGQWLCYDFNAMRVRPSHYSLRTADGSFPRSWVVEGSNGGSDWIVLDRRDNVDDLCAKRTTRAFDVARPDVVRMLRLRQTGENFYGDDALWLTAFEVFGSLTE
jgi:hypothetical protein